MPERLNGPVLKTGGRKSRGFESHPLRHALAACLAAAVLAGCAFTVQSFILSFPAQGEVPELHGVLNDQTGLVVSVEDVVPGPAPVAEFMSRDPTKPNQVVIQWRSESCDARVEITVSGTEHLTILVEPKSRERICELGGAPRAVLIEFSRPLDLAKTTFDMQR